MACFQHRSYTSLDCSFCVEVEHAMYKTIQESSKAASKAAGLLNAKDLANIAKTREIIQSGKPLFEKITVVVPREKQERLVKELTATQVKKIEKKWKAGIDGGSNPTSHIMYDLNNPNTPQFVKECFPQVEVKPDVIHCSYCGNEFPQARATYGRGPVRFNETSETVSLNPLVVHKKLRVTSQKIVACPDCCLKIKPKVDKDGNAIHSNIVTYSEG